MDESQRVVAALGRKPNAVEQGIFDVMWSEHCCYKSSKIYLRQLPSQGPGVLQGPGENAGIIDIGGGYAIAFKIESHNHPSFIEPYQGAATGVGGILRDIFTMGARPIALMDSLHFGAPDHARTDYLLRGVVAGIGGYGNAVGVPTVGGETHFDACYNGNILVNAFCLGVMRKDRIFRGLAAGVGNPVILVGSKTGRDGIHGATMASDVFDAASEEKRPTVQVGDPFTGKKLMEACLEAFQLEGATPPPVSPAERAFPHHPSSGNMPALRSGRVVGFGPETGGGAIVGIQDMGAAGFTCSSFEMSSKGGCGMELWLDKVPMREERMTPYEIMLSESQERMLLVANPDRVENLRRIFEKWELEFAVVGKVIADKKVRGLFHNECVFDLPTAVVIDEAPVYERPVKAGPSRQSSVVSRQKKLKTENSRLTTKQWIWRQYDTMVGLNTVVGLGQGAAVIRVKENRARLVLTCDSNADRCAQDPYEGTKEVVARGMEKLSAAGAKPLGITNCLNFGNPENPEVMWQFKEACRGLADACRECSIPVVSGNVSFYNETEGRNIKPTPVVAMVGMVK